MHICVNVNELRCSSGSSNAFSPGQCQAVIWANADLLSIWRFSFKKIYFISKCHLQHVSYLSPSQYDNHKCHRDFCRNCLFWHLVISSHLFQWINGPLTIKLSRSMEYHSLLWPLFFQTPNMLLRLQSTFSTVVCGTGKLQYGHLYHVIKF